jgi:hypothetical protein
MNNFINELIIEFRNDPQNIEEYKINIIKNYYYSLTNKLLRLSRNDMLVGVNKNPNIIFLKSKNDNIEIVYNLNNSTYFFNFRDNQIIQNENININIEELLINKKFKAKYFCNICNIL